MRIEDYYSRIVRDARSGRPTIGEARVDLRRSIEARLHVYRTK